MAKPSGFPPITTPALSDKVVLVQVSGPTDVVLTIQNLLTFIGNNAINNHKFSVFRTTAFNTPAGTSAKVGFDTHESWDTGTDFDVATNSRYNVPLNGFYDFNAQVAFNTGGSATVGIIQLYKNGTLYKYGQRIDTAADYIYLVGTWLNIQAVVGDYFEIFLYTSAARTGEVNSQAENFFQGRFTCAT